MGNNTNNSKNNSPHSSVSKSRSNERRPNNQSEVLQEKWSKAFKRLGLYNARQQGCNTINIVESDDDNDKMISFSEESGGQRLRRPTLRNKAQRGQAVTSSLPHGPNAQKEARKDRGKPVRKVRIETENPTPSLVTDEELSRSSSSSSRQSSLSNPSIAMGDVNLAAFKTFQQPVGPALKLKKGDRTPGSSADSRNSSAKNHNISRLETNHNISIKSHADQKPQIKPTWKPKAERKSVISPIMNRTQKRNYQYGKQSTLAKIDAEFSRNLQLHAPTSTKFNTFNQENSLFSSKNESV